MKIILLCIFLSAAPPSQALAGAPKKIGKCWNLVARETASGAETCTATIPDSLTDFIGETKNSRYRCSRKLGHKGAHHAHGLDNHCVVVWKK